MKKKLLLTMALLSTVVAVGGTPLTSHAAEAGNTKSISGKCYKVFIGQGIGSLFQTLEEIGNILNSNGSLCPSTTEESTPESPAPEVPTPETPAPPIADNPDNSTLSFAEQVVKLVNEERAKAGLPAVKMQEDITAAANVRAKEIKQSFSHTRPNGSSFSSVLKEQGVSFRGSGENIAWGQKSPEQVMNGWMNSEGHRANILNKNFKNIGVGHYQDEKGVNYWVQLFTY